MSKPQVVLYATQSLASEWLLSEIKSLGWKAEQSKSAVSKEGIAIIDVSRQEDIELVIEAEGKNVPTIIFSRVSEKKLLNVLFEFEICGFIHWGSDRKSIESTLEAAENSDEYFDERVLSLILSGKYQATYERIASLSNRELEIIDGIMEDLTNDEIAQKFNLSVRTVNAHKRNILQKLEERSLVGVARTMLDYTLRFG